MSSAESTAVSQPGSFDFRRRWTRRVVFNVIMNSAVAVITGLTLFPLVSVLYMVLRKGMAPFRLSMLWHLPPAAGMVGGGFGNALLGTLLMVGLGALISLPVGIATAVYLSEFSAGGKFAHVVRFAAKILSGLPSILAGVFVFATVVTVTGKFSLFAGGIALAILMFPIIALATEEALLRVPRELREASMALGATTAQTVLRIVIPAAGPSILTGVALAVARATGETAPLIFTALFSDYWINSLLQPTASMSVLIYNFSGVPYENQLEIAWSASLILIGAVLLTNVTSRLLARTKK